MDPARKRDVLIAYDTLPGLKPQIYIGVKLLADLDEYIRLVDSLAVGKADDVEVANPDRVWLENLDSLVLHVAQHDQPAVKIAKARGRNVCHWTCPPEGWELAGDMLRVLRKHGSPGHQYLPPDASEDDAEIEFDYAGHAPNLQEDSG